MGKNGVKKDKEVSLSIKNPSGGRIFGVAMTLHPRAGCA
jgi:hypothetical protein